MCIWKADLDKSSKDASFSHNGRIRHRNIVALVNAQSIILSDYNPQSEKIL